MNAIIPKIVDELQSKQPKVDFPKVTEDLLGVYGRNMITIEKTKDSDSTGVFSGSLAGYKVEFTYDAKTTDAYNKKGFYFFRAHWIPPEMEASCLAATALGRDDIVVLFHYVDKTKEWHAGCADLLFEGKRTSSPSSSGDNSSCSLLRPVFLNALMTVPLAWLLCFLF